jgi:hypothetical protein
MLEEALHGVDDKDRHVLLTSLSQMRRNLARKPGQSTDV